MSTKLTQRGSVSVLAVDGELVAETVGEFNRLVEQCRQRDGRDYVVDLAEARGIDSAGLEALTALQAECQERLGMLKLAGVDETIAKILEMTRLDRRFDCCVAIDDALAEIET
ncbi:MAG: STAS domain-containing protein [bacterium]|nr:STAS domain-containing protein [bacterium]